MTMPTIIKFALSFLLWLRILENLIEFAQCWFSTSLYIYYFFFKAFCVSLFKGRGHLFGRQEYERLTDPQCLQKVSGEE